jgi:heme-degrading monooxygenase HmoA
MIARTWSGRTPRDKADAYEKVVLETGIRGIDATPGSRGSWLLRRDDGDEVEFLLVSLWDSFENIKEFAGPDCEKARYYPEDDDFLLDRVEHVIHFDVVSAPIVT